MGKILFLSIGISTFFSLLGKESRIGPSVWWLMSFGLFWIAGFLGDTMGFPGVLASIGAEMALFIVVSIIWVMTPRKSSAEIFQAIEKAKSERDEQRFLNRGG
jgi:hypothetical protein